MCVTDCLHGRPLLSLQMGTPPGPPDSSTPVTLPVCLWDFCYEEHVLGLYTCVHMFTCV